MLNSLCYCYLIAVWRNLSLLLSLLIRDFIAHFVVIATLQQCREQGAVTASQQVTSDKAASDKRQGASAEP